MLHHKCPLLVCQFAVSPFGLLANQSVHVGFDSSCPLVMNTVVIELKCVV